jgi:dipeptide/tripeptide permease
MIESKLTWKFSKAFWVANIVELFERAAYYGMFIALVIFLTEIVGFSDIEAGWIGGIFAALLYLGPLFNGALADKIGFRKALLVAFAFLTIGYFLLGAVPTKIFSLLSLFFIIVGGSFVKPVIAATVAKTTDQLNRARGYSLFYQMVNIGSFAGKTIAKPLRTELGLEYINYYAAAIALISLLIVSLFYRGISSFEKKKNFREIIGEFKRVLKNIRFMMLILIVAGFWLIQGQLYATLPKYTLRMVGTQAAPEWYANVNPLIVILLVIPITHMVRKFRSITSIGIALALIPLSAFCISMSPLLEKIAGQNIVVLGLLELHPITIMMILGISLQGLAECFLSPRYYEFASKQASTGQEGLYLGYAHLHTFFAWLFGFILSGYLLDTYCPDPSKFLNPEQLYRYQELGIDLRSLITPEQFHQWYGQAHYIWYYFTVIGVAAFILSLIYRWRIDYLDRQKQSP